MTLTTNAGMELADADTLDEDAPLALKFFTNIYNISSTNSNADGEGASPDPQLVSRPGKGCGEGAPSSEPKLLPVSRPDTGGM